METVGERRLVSKPGLNQRQMEISPAYLNFFTGKSLSFWFPFWRTQNLKDNEREKNTQLQNSSH